jgi:YVTN family beta-propeller protein
VVATVPVGANPWGVAITPDGTFVYVANVYSNTVSAIATATNTVVATIPVGANPYWVAFTPANSDLCSETLKTSCSYKFSLEQDAKKAESIQLLNPGTVPRTATLEVLNPHSNLGVSLAEPSPISIAPGETKTLSIDLNARDTPIDVYDDLFLKVTVDDGSTLYASIKVNVGTGPLPDLAITADDISTSNANGTVTLTATVRNRGTAPASNVQVRFYEFDNPLVGEPTIAQIAPNGIGSASITIPAMTAGDHLIRVVVDPAGAIAELDKNNNEASRLEAV